MHLCVYIYVPTYVYISTYSNIIVCIYKYIQIQDASTFPHKKTLLQFEQLDLQAQRVFILPQLSLSRSLCIYMHMGYIQMG